MNDCIQGYFYEVPYGGGGPDVKIPDASVGVCDANSIRQKQQIFFGKQPRNVGQDTPNNWFRSSYEQGRFQRHGQFFPWGKGCPDHGC